MDRRSFLGTLVGGVGLAAAQRVWPFRVYSFPSEVKPVIGIGWIRPFTSRELEIYDAYSSLGQIRGTFQMYCDGNRGWRFREA